MPLSCLLRPMPVALAGYILLLMGLHTAGFLIPKQPHEWRELARRPCVRVEGTAVSATSEKRIGERVFVHADRAGPCADGVTARTPVELMAYLPRQHDRQAEFCPGCKIALEGRLRSPRWPRNPGEFDEQSFLFDRGVPFVFHARRLEILSANIPWRGMPACWAHRVHRFVHASLARRLDPETAGLMEGVLLGYKGRISNSANRSIQDAGVMHLLVPSGAKVGFIMAFLYWLCAAAGVSMPIRWIVLVFGGGFYVMIVGAEAPYVRAYLCLLAAHAAHMANREAGGIQLLVFSAFLILLIWPRSLFSAGFQMSYAAVFGLTTAMPSWTLPARFSKWIRVSVRILAASLVVQLMLCPILANVFGRMSLIGIVANAFLIPLSGILMAAGFSCCLVSLLPAPWLADIAAAVCGVLIRIFCATCAACASLPLAAIDLFPMNTGEVAAFYIAACGVLLLPAWRSSAAAWSAAVGLLSIFRLMAGIDPPDARVVVVSPPALHSPDFAPPVAAFVMKRKEEDAMIDGGISATFAKQTMKALGIRKIRRSAGSEVRIGGYTLSLDGKSGVIALRSSSLSDGKSEFCILPVPSAAADASEDCEADRSVSLSREGAVWITFKHGKYGVKTQREIYSVGRPLL